MSDEKNDNESDSSEILNDEDKIKNEDIISSSSDEENNQNQNQNQNQINNIQNKEDSANKYENSKLLGNKRKISIEHKEKNDYNNYSNNPRNKIKKYNNYSNEKKNFQPSLDIPLVTYDLFCELYRRKSSNKNINDEELKKFYDEYKMNHEQKNNEQFYNNHKTDEWFLEKYHPEKFVQFNEKERSEMCQKKSKIFFDSYDIENMINKKEIIDIKADDNLLPKMNYIFDLKEEHEYDKSIKLLYTKVNLENNKIEEIERNLNNIPLNKDIIQKKLEEDGRPYYFYNPDYLTLYNFTSLTKNIDIISVIHFFKKYSGFVSLSLTEPERINGYKRSFWVVYDNEENYNNVLNNLKEYELNEGFTIKIIKSETLQNPLYRKIKLTPPLFEERLEEDIIGTNKIITILDKYREIINNPLTENFRPNELQNLNEEEKTNILNLNILYLRKVHGFCYYCLKGFKDERNLTKKCDFLHLRHYIKLGKRENQGDILNKKNINIDEKELQNAVEFDKLFTEKLNEILNDKEKINNILLLRPKYLLDDPLALEKIEEEKKEFIKQNSEQLEEQKFECKVCKKKFIAFNFIENHMKNKHQKEMMEYAHMQVNEYLMKINFKEDKEKFNKSNIINNREDYEEYMNKLKSQKNNNSINGSSYEHFIYKKYKDWDDPINFQSVKNPYMKISYDDL